MVTIREVTTARDRKIFVLFPWLIYHRDRNWVPPLIRDQLHFLDPDKNPYYRHSKVRLLMAYRDGHPVGRLSVHENTLHVQRHNEHIGFFGFFECIDDFSVAQALFDEGANWLRSLGYAKVRGPANFSINGEYSLLVDGFTSSPLVMMTYNPAYYVRLIEQYGFKSAQEMYAYQLDMQAGLPMAIFERASKVEQTQTNFHVRKMDKSRLVEEAHVVFSIYREAWDENWGAVPPTEAEILTLAKELSLILDEDVAFIGEVDGKPIGFSLSIPDANQVLKAANGRLFPFGVIKMLWMKHRINAIRVLAMGVLKQYRHHGYDTVFYKRTYEESIKKGYHFAEGSLINESNTPMRHVLERIGGHIYKTYRMYDKDI